MGIISLIKHLLPSKRKERLTRVRECPDTRRFDELGSFFYDESVAMAVRFVQEQLARGDESPFRGVPKDRFFHEVVAVNFWALEKLFGAKHAGLVRRVLDNYARFFHRAKGADSAPQWIADRVAAYSSSWNDITGHQDDFGRKVAENIFPQGQAYSVPETSYWIIEYAHEVLDDLREMRDLCQSMRLELT